MRSVFGNSGQPVAVLIDPALTATQAAAEFGVSRASYYRHHADQIASIRSGAARRWPLSRVRERKLALETTAGRPQ
jgi:hypothetical protein